MFPSLISRTSPALVAVLLAATAGVAFGAWMRVGDAKVTFHGKGTGGFKLVGTTDQLTVRDDGATVTFTVPLRTLKTGIDLRDRHMHEKYLESAKYPEATLTLRRADLQIPARDGETKRGNAKGPLSIHGVTRDQEVQYTAQRTGGAQRVTASFPMNFRDHGINVPSYLGVTVKPELEVQVSFSLQE